MSSEATHRPQVGVSGPDVLFDADAFDVSVAFEHASRAHQTRTAVAEHGTHYSYDELAAEVRRLRTCLAARGVRSGDCVYVCAEPGFKEVVAVLATLAAGAAYVALQPDLPARTLHDQAEIARGRVALHDGGPHQLALVDRLQRQSPVPVVGLDIDTPVSREDGAAPPASAPARLPGTRTAYLGFTSGSTGRPKAVRIPHRAVGRLAAPGGQREIACGPGSSMLRAASLRFDASTLEVFLPLLNGGTVVTGPPGLLSITKLRAVLKSSGVTHVWLTAGLMRVVAERAPEAFAGVRHLLTGGDVVPSDAVRRVLATNPGLRVTNGYGPTENTTFTTLAHFDDPEQCVGALPIGRPLAGGGVVVLDPELRPVADGEIGEIAAWGLGLATDYLHDPTQTAASFKELDGVGRVYLTGDLGHVDSAGVVHFHGRADGQVRIRGHRVETEGVRQTLLGVRGVGDAYVFPEPGSDAANRRLVAAVVPQAGTHLSVSELREHLAELVPPHEVPQLWCVVSALPTTSNHKVDVRRLADLARDGRGAAGRVTSDQRPTPGRRP